MSGYKTDYQQKRVYAWEREAIAPHDLSNIPFDQAQSIVNYIWNNEGLAYAPKVRLLSGAERKGAWARGSRMGIYLREEGCPTWVLIHELAHALTMTADDEICLYHGKAFVGIYMKLVEKYLGISINVLMYLAKKYHVDFDINARPIFLD